MNNPYINLVSNQHDIELFDIIHPKFRAQISRFGGHLLSFIPTNDSDWLWLSSTAQMDGTKPIRGGVPLCWPWFGPAPQDFSGEPQHGYIRSVHWQLDLIEGNDADLTIKLKPENATELEAKLGLSVCIEFNFSESLRINLVTQNVSDKEVPLSQAIHTYFRVKNIDDLLIKGLDSTEYADKLTGKTQIQDGAVDITEAVDRVYQTNTQNLTFHNGACELNVIGKNHDSIVVWNPWQEKAKDMADFDDDGYQTMICIEMANTQGLKLAPGKRHTLKQIIKKTD